MVGRGWAGRLGGAGGSMVDAPRSSIKSIPRSEKRQSVAGASLPSVVLDHVSQLDDELSLFVLLTALKRVLLLENTKEREKNGRHKSDFSPRPRWSLILMPQSDSSRHTLTLFLTCFGAFLTSQLKFSKPPHHLVTCAHHKSNFSLFSTNCKMLWHIHANDCGQLSAVSYIINR